jgi:glycosyltransferase involved in cell wall biosynthesis
LRTISIVTPCYNEEDNVERCHETIQLLFEGPLAGYRREHVFCDNASSDRTVEILRGIAERDPNVRVILNSRNFGPFRNMWNGMLASTGDAVVPLVAADLQDPPEKIVEFAAFWEQGFKVVNGVRAQREEGLALRSARRVFYRIVNRWSPFRIPENAGEFQLLDRQVVEELRKFDDHYPYIRGMVAYCGFPAAEVSYTWRRRERGLSKNTIASLMDQGLNGIISFTVVPMRLSLAFGVLVMLMSFAVALFNLVMNLMWYRELAEPGIPTLIVAVFFFAGVQLFFLGMLGEYVLAIHSQVRKKPVVIEAGRINFPDELERRRAG